MFRGDSSLNTRSPKIGAGEDCRKRATQACCQTGGRSRPAYKTMQRESRFSYVCNRCGLCCHDKAITLSPYDVLRIARAARITTAQAIARYTLRRGSLLKFAQRGCAALDGTRCTLHEGRPLACRLYPLGLEFFDGRERFIRLEPATGSLGVYGERGNVREFLAANGAETYFEMNRRYWALIPLMRTRITSLADFDKSEPREFRRRAVREALAESGFDPNPLIDALFDPDTLGCGSGADTVEAHLGALGKLIESESDPERIGAAAVMLAVSLGCSPAEAYGTG